QLPLLLLRLHRLHRGFILSPLPANLSFLTSDLESMSSLAEIDNEEVEIKMMVAAAEVMVMVAETDSLAEVENEETEMMVMVVVVTDFVYGVILFKDEEENEIRKEIEISLCSKEEKKERENTKGKETEMTTPSPSFLVTKSIPEVVAIVANTSTVAEVIDVPRAMKDELLHKESRMTQIQNM
ncbi:hypothetical protein HID58_086339, partial [Brassica napus]